MRAQAHVPPSAIGLIVGAVLCFTLLDATVKYLADRYPIPLLVWARYTVQTLVILMWLLPKMGAGLLRTARPRLQLIRGAILPLSSLCFFSALKYLPLAEATAINYGTPILVIILAVAFLGERMTRPRIALVLNPLSNRCTWRREWRLPATSSGSPLRSKPPGPTTC